VACVFFLRAESGSPQSTTGREGGCRPFPSKSMGHPHISREQSDRGGRLFLPPGPRGDEGTTEHRKLSRPIVAPTGVECSHRTTAHPGRAEAQVRSRRMSGNPCRQHRARGIFRRIQRAAPRQREKGAPNALTKHAAGEAPSAASNAPAIGNISETVLLWMPNPASRALKSATRSLTISGGNPAYRDCPMG